MLTNEEGYLLGLICGRGHILERDRRIIVEFAHKNKVAYGIAYCRECGGLATAKSSEEDEEKELICKLCKRKVHFSVKREYEQKESTITSLKETIVPFLSKKFRGSYDIIGNDHLTLLVLDFKDEVAQFGRILDIMKHKTGFDSFTIPIKEISKSDRSSKIEFVNGLMDAAGFFNQGSWMPRAGQNGYGVMRGYFQIVRNWKIPVDILDLLVKEFSLTIQTIDWGHPNMRDQAKIFAWAREHQIKFFPEDYDIFSPKMKHKKEMFCELVAHNRKIKFEKKEIFGISPINHGQIKPYHPEENSSKIPEEIRGEHFDASWQIALKLGSSYLKEEFSHSKNKEILYLTGKDEPLDYKFESNKFEKIRNEKTKDVELKRKKIEENILEKEKKRVRTNPEQALYIPICEYLGKHFSSLYNEPIIFYDTSSYYLNRFISHNRIAQEFEYYQEYKIKPDLVGFKIKDKKILMAEVKATELSLRDLGQLRGYCLVANPEYAILISNKDLSINLKKILRLNKEILTYHGKEIKLGTWKNNKLDIIEV